jgi:hypothetical protein
VNPPTRAGVAVISLYDLRLINRVDELVGYPGAKNCSLDRGVDDRKSPKDFASFVQDWLENILFLCSARLNIC